ncbi:MAG TPA: hypothetical protein VKZ42_06175 [Flavobacteriaceae bacterium]|nr:hypothetical protein [Flavobacteriaceae bacterium]
MKNVLVIYYTQSGQLLDILQSFTSSLEKDSQVALTFCEIKPQLEFAFPWNGERFFNAFPESILQVNQKIQPIPKEITDKKWDLVILGYQVWFLSVSIPVNSFLFSEDGKKILKNNRVLTVIGCRNMWTNAQEKVKIRLKELHAELVGNIVLTDKAPNLISAYTIVKWMYSGKKEKYLGVFPKPGVSDQDIQNAAVFGKPVLESLKKEDYRDLQQKLVALGAVVIKPFIVTIEKRGAAIFKKWATFIITKKASRNRWLKIFNLYLAIAIWIISPIAYVLYLLSYPFTFANRKKLTEYYKGIQLK